MKIFIAIPAMDELPTLFCQSLAMLQRGSNEVKVGFQIGSLVYESRNNLGRSAMKLDADYVFWLDSDMVFQPDLMLRMLKICEEENIEFLSAVYFRRKPPYSTVLFDKLEALENGGCSFTTFESLPEGIFEIGGCGFGGVLMRTDVLFGVGGKFGRLFDPLPGMGEDLSFCWRARQAGFKLMCDSSLMMGHVARQVITKEYFDAYHEVGAIEATKAKENDDAG